ncbi:hypothetical protein ACSBR1_029825 [Camellia fascicularis]
MKNKNTNIASLFGLFSTFLFILLTAAISTPSVGAFKEFRVSDSEDKWGYFHCNMSNPISTFNNGNNTVVSLDKPGPMYFISGDPDHCKNGQRLVIQVMTCMHKPAAAATPLTVSGSFKSSRR